MLDIPAGSAGAYDIGVLEPFLRTLPQEEERDAMVLIFNLIQLHGLCNDFSAAVALLDYAEVLEKQVEAVNERGSLEFTQNAHMLKLWGEMAGRDAAMTIFHFGKTLVAIRSALNRLPSVKIDVGHSKLRAATRQFNGKFQNYEMVRHAVGHRAESTASVDALEHHLANGTFIFGALTGRIYTMTFEGSHRTIAIDNQVRSFLSEIVREVFSAFPKLEKYLPILRKQRA